MAAAIKPYFVVGGLYSQANGVARIMRDLAAALGRAGAPVKVYAAECKGRESIGHIFAPPTQWFGAPGWWLGGLSWSPALKSRIANEIRDADIVHNHSLWMLPNSYSSRLARKADRPVVITAHGTLEPWALNNARWKKRLVEWLFQSRDLRMADCIHVNSRQELAGVRAYGLKCPVAVIPNGVNLEEFEQLPSPSAFREAHPEIRDKKIALFMARLHKKKGLEPLIRAWASLSGEIRDWHLVIAGPDCGFGESAKSLVASLDLKKCVTFVGDLQAQPRLAALSAADIFVHPSFSEGFSMAVLEAMSCRLPVLITPGCNFPQAAAAAAAVEVEPSEQGIVQGMRLLMTMTESERRSIGNRARTLIQNGYTWDRVAAATLRLYDWLTGRNEAPDFIELN